MKKVLKIIGIAVAALLGVVVIYVAYLFLSYSRIPDMQPLETEGAAGEPVKRGESYTALIQNIGFGAYTADFTFFMDGGTESWAESRESVIDCVTAAADTAKGHDPDFILFQEVDFDSTRSYHIDESSILETFFEEYQTTFAVNYHSAFLAYPFTQPHGASNSGIMTLNRVGEVSSAVRRSLPISESVSKFLDLDRCYSKTSIPVEGGGELVLYNVHLSAYGGSDEIRTAQMTMLFEDMAEEYRNGNYCVCGGDFNHDFTGDSTQKLNGGAEVDFGWAQPFPEDLLPSCIIRCDDYEGELAPTCRNCDIPYEEGNFVIIVDGFLVTDNVEVERVQNIYTAFSYSDHCPVVLDFILK